MEDSADLHDWELVHRSDLTDNHMDITVLDEDTANSAIKDDYFAFGGSQHPQSEKESDEGSVDSDNPSCAELDSDSSKFLETSRGQLGFVGMKSPVRNSGGFWSDNSLDGKRSLADSEKVELGSLEGSVLEIGSEGSDPGCESLDGGSEGSETSDLREMTEIDGDASVSDGEKRGKIWWKVPLGLLKYFFLGLKPVWSVSIAASVVAMLILWKKLHRMKHKSRSIPLKIALDDKKASRLHEAMSAVRRIPIIRSSLQAGLATQWAALPLP